MPDKKDPNEGLADDAALATDLGDEDARTATQLEYYGGDPIEDFSDLEGADRGDLNDDADDEDTDRGDVIADDDDGETDDKDDTDEKEGDDDKDDSDTSDDDEDGDDADGDSEDDSEGDEDDELLDDGEEDSDEEDADVEDEEEEPKPKGIPRQRFNEVNQRMKNAEGELARRDAQAAAKDDAAEEKYDFDAAEDEYMGLLLDGKTKEAGAKRKEIREAEKADFKAEAKAEITDSVDLSAVEKNLDSLSKEAEVMFPAFKQNDEAFNPAAVSKTVTIMKGYQAEGMQADDAFVAALADVIDMFDLATESQGDADTDDKPTKKGKKVTKKAPIKKTKEKIKAAKQQGKSPVGEGKGSADVGHTQPDIEQLSDEEIDALPAETLSRMRGDFL